MTWNLRITGRPKPIPIRNEGGEVTTELPGRDATARLPVRIGLKSGDDIAPRDARTVQGARAQITDEQGVFFDGIVDDSELDEGVLVLRGHYSADAKGGPDGRGRREVLPYRVRDLGIFQQALNENTAAVVALWPSNYDTGPAQVSTGSGTTWSAIANSRRELWAIAPAGAIWTQIGATHRTSTQVGFFVADLKKADGSSAGTLGDTAGSSSSFAGLALNTSIVSLVLTQQATFAGAALKNYTTLEAIDLRGTTLTASPVLSSAVLAHAVAALCPLWSTDLTGIATTSDDVYELNLDLTDLDGVVSAVNGAWAYDFYIDGTGPDGLPKAWWQPFTFTAANTWTARKRDGAEIGTGGPSLEGLATDCWVTYTDPATGMPTRIRRTNATPPVSGRRIDITLDAGTVSLAVAQALGDAALNAASVQGATGTVSVPYGALRDPSRRVTPGWRLRAPAAIRVEDAVPLDLAVSSDVRDATTTFKVIGTTAHQDGHVDVRLDNDLNLLDVLVRRVQAAVGVVKE